MAISHLTSWNDIPEPVLIKILKRLDIKDVIACSEVCVDWNRATEDQLLWKHLFSRMFGKKNNDNGIEKNFELKSGSTSWKEECIRLIDNVPTVLIQTLKSHTDEVLHVAFSHDGKEFASCSKDNKVIIWKKFLDGYYMPSETIDMSIYDWTCPAQAQYSPSDTKIMVLGKIDIGGYTDLDLVIFSRHDNYKELCRLKDKNPFHPILQRFHENIGDIHEPYVHFLSTTISPNGYWYTDNSFLFATEENKSVTAAIDMYTSIWIHPIPNIQDNAKETLMSGFEDPIITFKSNYSEGWASFTISKNILSSKQSDTRNNSQENESNASCNNIDHKEETLFKRFPENYIPIESKLTETHPKQPKDNDLLAITLSLNRLRRNTYSRYGTLVHQITFHNIPSIHDFKPDFIEREPLKSLEIDGVIIGAAIDSREEFLYINVRMFDHKDSEDTGRYGQQVEENIQIRVINLNTLEYETEKMIGHKGFTKKIFNGIFRLDVETTKNFISSGSEDSKGYIWDRHYKCLVSTLPHEKCVSCVAFDPNDEERCVTASDDYTLKVWCSKKHKRCS